MESLDRILKKMGDLESSINQIKIELATKNQQEKNHQSNIERFWAQSWPEAMHRIDSNAKDIAKLQIEMTRLHTKMLVYGSLFFIGAPIISMFLIEFLKSIINKGI